VTRSSRHRGEDERARGGEKGLFWKNKEGLAGLDSMPSKARVEDKQRERGWSERGGEERME